MSKLAYITAALMIIPAPAMAQIVFDNSPPPAATAKGAKPKSDVEKVICRSQDTLGSRLQAHQVCMTKSQWFAYEQQYKDDVAGMQARTQGPTSN
jgi:hypothetical protein